MVGCSLLAGPITVARANDSKMTIEYKKRKAMMAFLFCLLKNKFTTCRPPMSVEQLIKINTRTKILIG